MMAEITGPLHLTSLSRSGEKRPSVGLLPWTWMVLTSVWSTKTGSASTSRVLISISLLPIIVQLPMCQATFAVRAHGYRAPADRAYQ